MIGEGRIKFFPSFFLIEKYGKLVRWYCMSDYTYKGDSFIPTIGTIQNKEYYKTLKIK